jgi:hypothetical protein
MSTDAVEVAGRDADKGRLTRTRALLEMFEEDRGRPAATIEELREWMGAQRIDQLQARMNRRLNSIDTWHCAPPKRISASNHAT